MPLDALATAPLVMSKAPLLGAQWQRDLLAQGEESLRGAHRALARRRWLKRPAPRPMSSPPVAVQLFLAAGAHNSTSGIVGELCIGAQDTLAAVRKKIVSAGVLRHVLTAGSKHILSSRPRRHFTAATSDVGGAVLAASAETDPRTDGDPNGFLFLDVNSNRISREEERRTAACTFAPVLVMCRDEDAFVAPVSAAEAAGSRQSGDVGHFVIPRSRPSTGPNPLIPNNVPRPLAMLTRGSTSGRGGRIGVFDRHRFYRNRQHLQARDSLPQARRRRDRRYRDPQHSGRRHASTGTATTNGDLLTTERRAVLVKLQEQLQREQTRTLISSGAQVHVAGGAQGKLTYGYEQELLPSVPESGEARAQLQEICTSQVARDKQSAGDQMQETQDTKETQETRTAHEQLSTAKALTLEDQLGSAAELDGRELQQDPANSTEHDVQVHAQAPEGSNFGHLQSQNSSLAADIADCHTSNFDQPKWHTPEVDHTSKTLDEAVGMGSSGTREIYDKDFQRDAAGNDGWELQWMDTTEDGTEKQYWLNEITGEAQWVLPFGRKKFISTVKAITAMTH